MSPNQIKSKKRVRDYGEVFTPDFIVNDMLDLIKNETERIESRFLEPACGDGNFLAPILERKLEVVNMIRGQGFNLYYRLKLRPPNTSNLI